ncbi:hypothetical protein ACTXT7_003108 [Hymenolepis weldensis]
MIGGYIRVEPTEVSTVKHEHEVSSNSDGPRVNASADANMETPQTVVVTPPWIDSLGNGGRPCLPKRFASSHKALKIQDWMDGREFSLCHTKLMAS